MAVPRRAVETIPRTRRTADHRPVYIRAKHGVVSARIGPIDGSISDAVRGEELLRIAHEEADTLSSEDILLLLANTFDFSQLKSVEPFDEWRVVTEASTD